MGLKEVKDEILEEARQEADEIRQEAEEEAEEILEDARKEAESIREKAEEDVESEKESMEKKKLSNARMEARQLKLEAKQEKIDEVFRNFERRVRQMSKGEKEDFVSTCIDRVEFEIDSAKASDGFVEALESEGIDTEEIDEPGLVLVSDGGERRRDFRLERVVESYRDSQRKEIAEVLFDQ